MQYFDTLMRIIFFIDCYVNVMFWCFMCEIKYWIFFEIECRSNSSSWCWWMSLVMDWFPVVLHSVPKKYIVVIFVLNICFALGWGWWTWLKLTCNIMKSQWHSSSDPEQTVWLYDKDDQELAKTCTTFHCISVCCRVGFQPPLLVVWS